jgi:hypothetical protein
VARDFFCGERLLITCISLFFVSDMHELAKRYRGEYDLPNLKLPYNGKQGFYISIPAKDVENEPLPRVFIQVRSYKHYPVISNDALDERRGAGGWRDDSLACFEFRLNRFD